MVKTSFEKISALVPTCTTISFPFADKGPVAIPLISPSASKKDHTDQRGLFVVPTYSSTVISLLAAMAMSLFCVSFAKLPSTKATGFAASV